jgi:TolB protein
MPYIRLTDGFYTAVTDRYCRLAIHCLIWFALVFTTLSVSWAQEPLDIVGHIAFVGADHNVYVVGSSGARVALSSDGSTGRRYQFPTWATDGRLAFFCCDVNFSSQMSIETYVASPDLTAAKLLKTSVDEAYTYSYWSPSACSDGAACRELALLLARRGDSFRVDLIRVNDLTATSRVMGTGVPYYFSWRRDGQRILWYRNNSEIALYDVETSDSQTYQSAIPGGMQAPAWSPADDRAAVILRDDSDTNAVVILDGEDQTVLLGGIPAEIRGSFNITAISWSPDGSYIAYRLINRFGASPLFVLDTENGTTVAATTDINVVAFFWSPDSKRILYLTPGGAAGDADSQSTRVSLQTSTPAFTWSILDLETGRSHVLTSFTPTASMFYLLAFFDQFSQSHQLWSPDSRYIVYAEMIDGGESLVKILDTTADAFVPFTVAEGDIGIWSYQ